MSEQSKPTFYSLQEIANWHKADSKIQLPSLQREFVWKPYQIELLWDSILQGYPLGAIMMSVDEFGNKFLLDGQQRCTSIALGYLNPLHGEKASNIFSLSTYMPSVWIDLKPHENHSAGEQVFPDGRRYVIRVSTQSHPWGYQMAENQKTLAMKDRSAALEFYTTKQQTEKYTDLKPINIHPWDTRYPIPLAMLLTVETSSKIEFIKQLREKLSIFCLKETTIKTKNQLSGVDYEKLTDKDLEPFFEVVKRTNTLFIPEICIKADVLKETSEVENEEKGDDPTLFVRLNSAGTRISGDDLIYSIYKAAFPDGKKLVEAVGAGYIKPSKLISLFCRLAQSKIEDYQRFQKQFNVNTFRKRIKEKEFQKTLQAYLSDKNASSLIEQAISILSEGQDDFPPIILKQLIVQDLELFFVLLAYIEVHKRDRKEIDKALAKEISSTYVHILWFSQDHNKSKLAARLFNLLFHPEQRNGWREALGKLIKERLVAPILEPMLLALGLQIYISEKNEFSNDAQASALLPEEIKNAFRGEIGESLSDKEVVDCWHNLLWKIKYNKTMLLFAQRDFLKNRFPDFNQFENIDDTNRPWDWDHIYPSSWVYRKNRVPEVIRIWNGSIGNLRALSYDDNRSENNRSSPKERLQNVTIQSDSFINANDWTEWEKIDGQITQWSGNVNNYCRAVITRMINIYRNWYDQYYVLEDNVNEINKVSEQNIIVDSESRFA